MPRGYPGVVYACTVRLINSLRMGGLPSTDKHTVPKCNGSVRTRVFTFAACNLNTFPLYQITSLPHQTIKKVKSKMYITVHQ
jgi:hypothetical protein